MSRTFVTRTQGGILFATLTLAAIYGGAVIIGRFRHATSEPPFGPAICFPEPTSPANRALEGKFDLFDRVERMPPNIRPAFLETHGTRWAIADPGKSFEPTDNITDPSLPSRRVILGGRSEDTTFVHYEQGGWGLGFVVAAFRADTAEMKPLWRRYCPHAARDFDDLKSMIRSGQCRSEAEWHIGLHCKEGASDRSRMFRAGTVASDN